MENKKQNIFETILSLIEKFIRRISQTHNIYVFLLIVTIGIGTWALIQHSRHENDRFYNAVALLFFGTVLFGIVKEYIMVRDRLMAAKDLEEELKTRNIDDDEKKLERFTGNFEEVLRKLFAK